MTHSRYFPKTSTFSPSLQYKGDILKHKRGISTYFGKTTVLWRKHFEKSCNSGNIFIHDFAKCNANVSLKSSLTCTIKNLKCFFFIILSLPNEGFPWVWVHLIRARQCSIFQLHFEDVQWTSEVARSQRKAP